MGTYGHVPNTEVNTIEPVIAKHFKFKTKQVLLFCFILALLHDVGRLLRQGHSGMYNVLDTILINFLIR
jgi:hypothetical protein